MKRTDLTYRLTKVGGKVTSAAVCALTGALLFGATGMAHAAIDTTDLVANIYSSGQSTGGVTPQNGQYQHYSYSFTASKNSTFLTFLFRSDPAYFGLDNVSLTANGGANVLSNGDFESGRASGMNNPAGWSLVGTQGLGAAGVLNTGTASSSFNHNPYAGSAYWDDGAVGGFDGIAQAVTTSIGQSYTVSFWLGRNSGWMNNQASTTAPSGGSITQMLLYAGDVPAGFVVTPPTPSTTDIGTAQPHYLASQLGSTVNPVFVGGTLQIDSANPTITQNFTVSNSSGTIDANGNSATFSGTLANASGESGGLTLSGVGRTTFSGNNSYSGATGIANGATLALSDSGSIASSSGVNNNGSFNIAATSAGASIKTLSGNGSVALGNQTLTLSQASDTFSGNITGTGGLSISGGTETLSGVNSYSGATGIANGATLALSGSGSIASSSGVNNNGRFDIAATSAGASIKTLSGNGSVALGNQTLTLSQASDTFSGNIAGAGGLSISGGTETLSGVNSYSGATGIANGATLALSDSGSIASSSGVNNNGSFNIAATSAGASIKTLSGNGSVALGNQTLTLSQASDTFSGNITGTGGLSISGGTETLSGVNSYSGGTRISGGGKVQVAADSALGAANGALVLDNGSLVTTATHGSARMITLGAGGGTFDVASSTVLTENGRLSGVGGLSKDGGGTLVLCDAGYGGATSVNAGTLKACRADALSPASASTVAAGATLDLNNYRQTIGSLAGAGQVLLGSATLTTGGNNSSTTFAGDMSGSGALVKTGSGTLSLAGDSHYTGATTVAGGTLKTDKANTLASASAVTVLAGAKLDLNNYGQSIGSLAGAGNVELGTARLTAGSDNTSTSFSGAISGTGTLVKNGTGTLTLSGVNTFSGMTVNGGVLQVATDTALGAQPNHGNPLLGSVTLNGGTLQTTASMSTDRLITLLSDSRLLIADGTTFTESGGIAGSGRLLKDGSGTLALTGNNTYSGGTIINGGIVDVAVGSSLGTGTILLNGGTLHMVQTLNAGQEVQVGGKAEVNVAQGTTTVLAGAIRSGDGGGSSCFNKTGAGTLSMTGNVVLNSGACVQEGILSANGVFNSQITVDAGATLRGTGRIVGDLSISGRLAPGNSPGLLSQVGSTTMLGGSSFQEDIDGTTIGNGAGHYSHLGITGGQFIINSNVSLTPLLRGITGSANNTFTPVIGDMFRIITADGGIVGRFDTLTQPSSGLAADTRLTAFYNMQGSNSVDLTLMPTSYAAYLGGGKGNVNAQTAGGVLDKLLASQDNGSASSRQSGLLYAVSTMKGNQLPTLATALAGEIHGALAAAAPQAGRGLQGKVTGRLDSLQDSGHDMDSSKNLWMEVSTSRSDADSDKYASGFSTKRDQYTLGRDLYRNGRDLLGVGLSYASNHVSANGGSGSVDDSLGFVYGQMAAGRFMLDGIAAYGTSRWESNRADPLRQTGALQTVADGKESLFGVGLRLPLQLNGQVVEPFARALWQRSTREGIDEGTASDAGLSFGGYAANGTRLLAGLSGGSAAKDPSAERVTFKYSVALGRDVGDDTAVRGRLAGESITVLAPRVSRSFVQTALSGTLQLNRHAYVHAGLNAETGKRQNEVSVTAGLRISF